MYLRGAKRLCPKCGGVMRFDEERFKMGYSPREYCPACRKITTIRPDIDEHFLTPLFMSEGKHLALIVGTCAVLGFFVAVVIFAGILLF
jgi:hypothetical protein